MLTKSSPISTQSNLFHSELFSQLDVKDPLIQLANTINWTVFDDAFEQHYSQDNGRPSKPIRLMVGLLLLKQLENLSDEHVVLQFKRNPYYQYFCGYSNYMPGMPGMPCNATELVHFRKRIGVKGFNLIFRDLCINRNNHQKPTFHPLGDFLNPALALLGQGLKKSPIGQKLDFANHPYLCKGLF
jgi:IS5 family transposase